MPQVMTVVELKQKLESGEPLVLVDCREQDEHQYCKIDGSVLIPLSQFESRAPQELQRDQNIVIHCHHGGRSNQACLFLERLGYTQVTNVTGGIEQWSLQVDPKVKRY